MEKYFFECLKFKENNQLHSGQVEELLLCIVAHRIYPVLKSGSGQKKKLSWMTRKRRKKTRMKTRMKQRKKKRRRNWRFVDNLGFEQILPITSCEIKMGCWSGSTHLNTWMERGTVRVKCLAQEHSAMSLAKA